MSALLLLTAVAVVVALAFGRKSGGSLPGTYSNRSCQGKFWRQAFPGAPKQEIREFLSLFVASFAYREKEKLKLAPTDQILGIYRAQYPSREIPDALEFETLAQELARKYGIKLESIWREDLTLGELFGVLLPRRQTITPNPALQRTASGGR